LNWILLKIFNLKVISLVSFFQANLRSSDRTIQK